MVTSGWRRQIRSSKVVGARDVLATVRLSLTCGVPLAYETGGAVPKVTKAFSYHLNGSVLKGMYLRPRPPMCSIMVVGVLSAI